MPEFDHFRIAAPWYDKIIYKRNFDLLIELAKLPSSGHLLDIGGGTGRVAKSLEGVMDHIEVVDISLGMLRISKEKKIMFSLRIWA